MWVIVLVFEIELQRTNCFSSDFKENGASFKMLCINVVHRCFVDDREGEMFSNPICTRDHQSGL